RMGRSKPRQSNPPLVIHHMHMVVLSGMRAAAPTMMLESAVNVVRDLDLAALLAHKLLHTLPRRVVEIVRMDRGLGPFGLGAEDLHMVAVVPLEVARGRLRECVAASVERVVVNRLPNLHTAKAIVGGLHGELAGETALFVAMLQAQQVAHGVVG